MPIQRRRLTVDAAFWTVQPVYEFDSSTGVRNSFRIGFESLVKTIHWFEPASKSGV